MRTLSLVLVTSTLLSCGCQGRRLFSDTAGTGSGSAPAPSGRVGAAAAPAAAPGAALPGAGTYLGGQRSRGGFVQLSARELAPLDAWIDARNAQWVVGDDVLIEASREYFGPVISLVSRTASVQRTDEVQADVTITTLAFLMGPLQAAVENNPRAMIGTGLTVSARKTLRLRLFKTNDSARPVQLRVTASGDASRGRKDKVEQRAPTIQLGGNMRRGTSGWAWYPFG